MSDELKHEDLVRMLAIMGSLPALCGKILVNAPHAACERPSGHDGRCSGFGDDGRQYQWDSVEAP